MQMKGSKCDLSTVRIFCNNNKYRYYFLHPHDVLTNQQKKKRHAIFSLLSLLAFFYLLIVQFS